MAVVIIIGILTAVALPQYNKVVARSRFTNVQTMAKSFHDSCQRLVSEWGVNAYSDVPVAADGTRSARLDIGSNELLPAGFSFDGDGVILGGEFQFTLQDDCSVRLWKFRGKYMGVTMNYDGRAFKNCIDNGNGACDLYNAD